MRYEFKCKNCGSSFELVIALKDFGISKITCPDCHSDKVEKKFFSLPIIFKGNGFYKTDNSKINEGQK